MVDERVGAWRRRVVRQLGRGVAAVGAVLCITSCTAALPTQWPTYGRDAGGTRFAPLEQITPLNVSTLRIAWTYHMQAAATISNPKTSAGKGDEAAAVIGSSFVGSEVTPLVVDNVMFISTPYRRVVALHADTGHEVWSFEVPGPGQPSLRGVEYWPGDREHEPRIVFGTRDGRLIALDAATGRPAEGFGDRAVVELKRPEIAPASLPSTSNYGPPYGMTSPPVIYRNVVITGSATQEFPTRGASGSVQAWDVISGKHLWTFHSVPQPGQPGHETWQQGSGEQRSGVNVWGFMTVDVERGIVYMPFGAPAWDRYGGDRKGANLFSSSLVAVDALTGRYRWHFQVVHHDIWDNDLQAPPALFDVRQGSRTIPAVAIVSKNGLLFLLDRRTGVPVHPVEERPVPASDVPGEETWPTQPFPVRPPPLARNSFSAADIATVTPELRAFCENFVKSNDMRYGGPYLPVGFNTVTINFPGLQGGANWGGTSFDPTRRLLFVNTSDMGQVTSLEKTRAGPIPVTRGPVSGRFQEPASRLMCQQPPWGRLSAVDVDRGEIVWQSVLGVSDNVPEARQKTGRPNVGGSIATRSGLVFIGATDDARFRAFDSRTGAELWSVRLKGSAHATPITYLGRSGKQYVVIAATGGSFIGSPMSSDEIVAFALP